MALRFDQISAQLSEMTAALTAEQRRVWLAAARRLLREVDEPRLREKLSGRSRVPWLVAQPLGALGEAVPCPPCPDEFTVIAADGSTIPPDRHSPVRYYVINTGTAALTYGRRPDARLAAAARFCHDERDLYLDSERRRFPVEGNRLSAQMLVEEMAALRAVAATMAGPVVALLDGTLILWMIQTEPQEVRELLLATFLDHLDWFQAQRIPIVGYISDPGSFELGNALRVYLCPEPSEQCRACATTDDGALRLCHELRHFRDPALLAEFLRPGERTCLFASTSEILRQYGAHTVSFFYLRTADVDGLPGEIARVELPGWVAADPALLDLVHTVLCDQCHRSGSQPPYPPALHEAHEQAVISTADRDIVEMLVEEALARRGITFLKSAKARHKRSRGV